MGKQDNTRFRHIQLPIHNSRAEGLFYPSFSLSASNSHTYSLINDSLAEGALLSFFPSFLPSFFLSRILQYCGFYGKLVI
jgi:hypothetical protein